MISWGLKKLALAVSKQGTAAKAFLVGGCVRDRLLGLAAADADVEVYGIEARALEKILRKVFPNRVNLVGKSFGVYKISLEKGEIDVSIPRRESKAGRGHRAFSVAGDPGMLLQDAARRRDFTINALAQDILGGQVIDYYGGRYDLKKRLLRAVDPKTFPEDPLRVYRALQFAARFNLTVEASTLRLLKRMVRGSELEDLSKDRVSKELEKLLLRADRPSVGLRLAADIGLIKKYFPELWGLRRTPQDPKWHPEGNVWIHTLLSVDAAASLVNKRVYRFSRVEKLQIMLACLCHDIGKEPTTKFLKGKWRSYGHDRVGAQLAKRFLEKFSFGAAGESAVIKLVAEHMQPKLLYKALSQGRMTKQQYAGAVRRLLVRLSPVPWKMLLVVSDADSLGRGPKKVADYGKPEKLLLQTIKKQGWDKKLPQPLLQGRDVLALARKQKVNLKPGPKIGELLRSVEKRRDEGKISNKKEALDWIKKFLIPYPV